MKVKYDIHKGILAIFIKFLKKSMTPSSLHPQQLEYLHGQKKPGTITHFTHSHACSSYWADLLQFPVEAFHIDPGNI